MDKQRGVTAAGRPGPGPGGPARRRFVGRRFVPGWPVCAAVWCRSACCPLLSLSPSVGA